MSVVVVAALLEEDAEVEIEATAVVPTPVDSSVTPTSGERRAQ
jgi:hypothetical protein